MLLCHTVGLKSDVKCSWYQAEEEARIKREEEEERLRKEEEQRQAVLAKARALEEARRLEEAKKKAEEEARRKVKTMVSHQRLFSASPDERCTYCSVWGFGVCRAWTTKP